jgi:Fic family protein
MKDIQFELLPVFLLKEYISQFDKSARQKFEQLKDSELSVKTFSFYTSVSAVFSSKIEGEAIELDSFIKHKMMGVKFLPDYTQKIDDLYEAYQYAQNEALNKNNAAGVHQIITRHILKKQQRGKIRGGIMYVVTPDGKIEYVACPPGQVGAEMEKLYNDIEKLIKEDLSFEEILYFASVIHLVFVKIHPFDDGNGRTARLLEKWFLAQKLDARAWFIQSEKHYYQQHQTYYTNIRRLGMEYELLDYSNSLPFLMMLPQANDQNLQNL